MAVGFPQGKPRTRPRWAYYHLASLQAFRTTYKAAPLAALPLALLAGTSLSALVAHARTAQLHVLRTRVPAIGLLVAFVAIAALFARPLITDAVDPQQAYGSIPKTWTAATADASRATPRNRRVAVLPGELFGYYRWGDTMDPIGPAARPAAADPRDRAPRRPPLDQLQEVADELVQQGPPPPGQLDGC